MESLQLLNWEIKHKDPHPQMQLEAKRQTEKVKCWQRCLILMSQAARSSRRSWSSSSPTSRWGYCGGAGEPRRARLWDTPSSTRSWPPCPIGWSRRSERAEPAAYRGRAPSRVLIPMQGLVVCWLKQHLLAWPSGGQTAKSRRCRVYRLVFSPFEKICVF